MQQHPYFDLRLHPDDELADWIGEPMVERFTLHEWPLSCVQRVTGFSDHKWIYKAESGPTVEHHFYAQASGPLLPDADTLYDNDGYVCLLIEYIDAVHFEPAGLSEQEIVQAGKSIVQSIAQIEGELPAYWVVDWAQWKQTVANMLRDLTILVEGCVFSQVCPNDIATIRRACNDEALVNCLTHDVGLVHGDLTADNVLVAPGAFESLKLIDWQYVLRGPRRLDLATFLDSLRIDPVPYVGSAIVKLMLIMRIHWLVECATKWFVAGTPTYDREIARICARLIRLG